MTTAKMTNPNNKDDNGSWVYCEQCGKKLLRRKPNGTFVFKFGRNQFQESVVHIEIYGSVKVKCFREDCGHFNTINFFPS